LLHVPELGRVITGDFVPLESITLQVNRKVELYLQGLHTGHGAIMPGNISAQPCIVADNAETLTPKGPLETACEKSRTGGPVDIAETDIDIRPLTVAVKVEEIGPPEIPDRFPEDALKSAMIGKVIPLDTLVDGVLARLSIIKGFGEAVTPGNDRLHLGTEEGRS
jgi:hypothetical protein